MAYYLKYNDVDLTNIVKVRSVEIPSLPSIEHSSIDNIFERDGNIFNGLKYGNRDIKLTFIVYPDDPNDYQTYINDVKRAFYVREEAQLYCGNETLYIWAVPVGDMTINELSNTCAEIEVELVAYDPYWYSTTQNVVNNESITTFEVENTSDVEIFPSINIGFNKDTTFVQLENQTNGERILIGGIPSVEGTTVKKNTMILKDAMESTNGWSASTGLPLDDGRVGGGSLSVTSTGAGLMCGNFGSSNDATWHGVSARKSLDQSLSAFSCKIRMSFNSSGTNADPEHPYTNDTETVTSGSKSTYYKTTASLNLRKGAGTSYAKLCTMPSGTKLTGTVTNGWLKTTYNGKTGYCSTKYLKKYTSDNRVTTKQRNYVTVKSTAIRSSASKSATNKKTIPAGKCIRCIYDTKYPTTGKDDVKGKFFKLAKAYEGVTGYVWIDNLVQANDYTVDYEDEPITSDDKTGVCEIYGYSANNVQLFKMCMIDSSEYYEHNYPIIRKNSTDFLIDQANTPAPKTITKYENETKKVENILSGKYGSYTEFYGEFFIQRTSDNKWSCYVQKIKDGKVVKEVKSKTVTDTKNADEKLNYLVIYYGTTGNAEKACGMSISDIEVRTLAEIDNTVKYNFQEFEVGDILEIDNSTPSVRLNGVEHNELIDVGSQFFKLETGINTIKVASDDTNINVDVIWNNKYL